MSSSGSGGRSLGAGGAGTAVLAALARLAQIRVGETTIRIAGRSPDEVRRAVLDGRLLVVGEPGAGKSGTLHDVVEALRQAGRDVILLSVDRLAASSLDGLRAELGLAQEVPDVLASWPGTGAAFLVVDALDAARDDRAVTAVRDLIRIVTAAGGGWRVVASIRKLDLRYSVELRELFAGMPRGEFRDEEFSGMRHVNWAVASCR